MKYDQVANLGWLNTVGLTVRPAIGAFSFHAQAGGDTHKQGSEGARMLKV